MADLRKCIGSAKFGIEPHEAPVGDFPAQPSQKDGLGRMCKPHWTQYTSALRKAALARKAAAGGVPAEVAPTEPEPVEAPEPVRNRSKRGSKTLAPAAASQGDAGSYWRHETTHGRRAPPPRWSRLLCVAWSSAASSSSGHSPTSRIGVRAARAAILPG